VEVQVSVARVCPRCLAHQPGPHAAQHCFRCGFRLHVPAPDIRHLEHVGEQLLVALGLDPGQPGLRDTPGRWARWWFDFATYHDDNMHTAFETVSADQVVVVKGMQVWSICEHHLMPFSCEIAVGYITHEKVLGLSKFARIAHQVAHRLQLQERLVEQVADAVQDATSSPDVAVLARGVHLCMVARGIRTEGEMVTSVVRGVFRESAQARAEFMGLAS